MIQWRFVTDGNKSYGGGGSRDGCVRRMVLMHGAEGIIEYDKIN